MKIQCITDHSPMASIENGSRNPSDNVAFRRHVRYWDRGDKGYITPIDTTAGFMDLGYGPVFSIVLGAFLSASVAYATQDSWIPDPLCRIQVGNLARFSNVMHSKHRDKQSIYNEHGELDAENFERLYTKYAQWDPYGKRMTFSEAIHMASEQGSFGVSPLLWSRAILEWIMVYCIAGNNGAFAKDDIQAIYNGTLFFHLRNVRSKNAHSHWIAGNKTKTLSQQPSCGDKEIIHPADELGATPTTSSHKQAQKPMIPIVQAPETYGKLDSNLMMSMLSQQLTEGAAQTPLVGELNILYFDNDDEKENGIEFGTGYDCFVHCPSFDKYSDEGGTYNDDHRVIFTGLVESNNNDDASNGSNASLFESNHDAEDDHRTLHNMLVQVPEDLRPKRHMELEPVALHGLQMHDIDSDKGSHFVQTPSTMPSKKDTIIHTYVGSLTGVQPEQDHHVTFEQDKRMMPKSYDTLSNDDKENTFALPLSVGLSKSDSGYTSIVEEPDYVRYKSPIELEKVSLSGLQSNGNDQESADVAFDATQSKLPLVNFEEWMSSDKMKAQAGLQEHMLKNWLTTESLTGVDTASCYQDASETMPDEYDQDKENHDSQWMHGLASYDEPSVCKNLLNIDVLPGVKSDMQLYDDAVPERGKSEELEYWRQAFPLVGVSNNEDIPLKNWLNTGNLHGVQQEGTALYESDAQGEVPSDSFEPLELDVQHELEMLSGIQMDVTDKPSTKNRRDAEMLYGIDPISSKSAGDSIPYNDVQPMSKEDTQTLKKPLSSNIDDTSFTTPPPKDRLKSSTLLGSQTLHDSYATPEAFTHERSIEATFQNKNGDMTPKEPMHQRQRAATMDATSDLPELTDPGKPPCEEKSKALPPLPTSTAHSSDDDEQSVASFGSIQPPVMPVLPKKQSPHHDNMIIEREHWPIMTDVTDCKE